MLVTPTLRATLGRRHRSDRNVPGGPAFSDLMARVLSAAAALLLAPTTASAAAPVERSPDLWATVNICDTAAFPDRIGIRGSMPGLGRRATLYMRFDVHYLARSDGKWHNMEEKGNPGLRKVGRTAKQVLESGYTFLVPPPSDGGAHTLRGSVTFVWKRKGRTVERRREVTEAGHRSTKGADPPGYTAAICHVS